MVSGRVFFSVIVSLVLVGSLVGGGLLHGLVPHAHGEHTHGQTKELPLIWGDLHGMLSHQGKKTFLALLAFAVLVLGLLPRSLYSMGISRARLREFSYAGKARDPSAGELLRRGIHPYRAFG